METSSIDLPAGATGVVEHFGGTFLLERETGDVLFGDGLHGPVLGTADIRYRLTLCGI